MLAGGVPSLLVAVLSIIFGYGFKAVTPTATKPIASVNCTVCDDPAPCPSLAPCLAIEANCSVFVPRRPSLVAVVEREGLVAEASSLLLSTILCLVFCCSCCNRAPEAKIKGQYIRVQ